MKKILGLLIISLFSFQNILLAENLVPPTSSAQLIVNELKEEGLLSFSDRPAVNIFLEQTCGNEIISGLGLPEKEKLFCEVVTKSDTCQDIEVNDLRNCQDPQSNILNSGIDVIVGCAKGLFNSVKELLAFLWEAAKFIWDNVTDWDKAASTADSVSAFSESIKLYLYTEYDKAYETASFPRAINAAREVASGIFQFLGTKIAEILEDQYTKFGCLNEEAKTKKVCHIIGDLVLPPAAFFAFLKRGVKAADEFPSLKKAFDGMNSSTKLSDYKVRLGNADSVLGKKLSPVQQQAVVDAHLVGIGETGLDGSLAGVGNYTIAQLRRKSQILKEAGLSREEIRKLMENSIVGIGPDEFAKIPPYRQNVSAELTPDARPEYENIRAALREGAIPQDPYISFVAPDGSRLAGRLDDYGKNTGEAIVTLTDGRRVSLSREQVGTLRQSGTSRQAFEEMNLVQNTRPSLSGHPEPSYESVRSALRDGKIPNDPYVSFVSPTGHRFPGKIEHVDPSSANVTIRLQDGSTKILRGEELLELRTSSVSRDFFTKTKPNRIQLQGSSDPRVAPIRDALNHGVQPSDPFVSVQLHNGQRIAARIDEIDSANGRVALTYVDGSRSYVSGPQLETLRLSDTAKDGFRANQMLEAPVNIVAPTPRTPVLSSKVQHHYTPSKVSIEQQKRYLQSLKSEQISTIHKYQAYPDAEFKLPNGKMAVSPVMDMGGGRNFAFVYLTLDDGSQVVRSAYRSNSQGVWRLSDAMTNRHFSKGVGEEFMSIPPEVQRHLHQQLPVREIDLKDIVQFDMRSEGFGGLQGSGQFESYNVMRAGDEMIPRINRDIPPVQRPQNIRIQDENLRPNFENLQSKHRFNHPQHGDVEVLVYPSKNGAVSFTVMKDPEGKVWFADVYPNGVDINNYGIPKRNYDFGDLTTPRWEYHSQIAEGYLRAGAETRGNYGSNWAYVKEIPEIQAWYRSQGLPIPD